MPMLSKSAAGGVGGTVKFVLPGVPPTANMPIIFAIGSTG